VSHDSNYLTTVDGGGEIATADGLETADDESTPALSSLRFIGPVTADILTEAAVDAATVREKRISYLMLVEMGVNPGVAAKIRREHSLAWSFRSGGDLTRRSMQVRGLGSEEAAWVAASAGDWERPANQPQQADTRADRPAADSDPESTADTNQPSESIFETPWPTHSGQLDAVEATTPSDSRLAEAVWRAQSKPTPLSAVDGLDQRAIDQLQSAGITSVRSLVVANPERIATVLSIDCDRFEAWQRLAAAVAE